MTVRIVRFCSLYLLVSALVFGGSYLFEERYYFRDPYPFESPLISATTLRIREDRLGKGTFGAPRSGKRRHLGIDLLATEGEPVVAVRSGVAQVEHQEGMGTFVKIKHREGLQTIYGHLSEAYLPRIARVRQGQVIGAVGKSGNASRRAILPHLHFEIRDGKQVLDPTPFIQEALARPRKRLDFLVSSGVR